MNTDEAITLQHGFAVETEALNPPHTYVPWIVADGVHTEDINDQISVSLLDYVCQNYQGTKAAACDQVSKPTEAVVSNEKCYRESLETKFLF